MCLCIAGLKVDTPPVSSEELMVEMIKKDLGVTVDPQAWRMFLRYRWVRFAPLAARIHEGKT